MPDTREEARQQYTKARSEFEKLNAQDKTAFVVEATFATLGHAVEETGRHLADAFEAVFDFGFGTWAEPGSWRRGPERGAPNPAEPPAASKRAAAAARRKKAKDEDPKDEDE